MVAHYGRIDAFQRFGHSVQSNAQLSSVVWTLLSARLVCHRKPNEDCHADSLIALFQVRRLMTAANPLRGPHSATAMSNLAKLREEPDKQESSPDEVNRLRSARDTRHENSTVAKHWHHLDVGPSDEECVCRTKPMDCASSHGSPRLLMDLALVTSANSTRKTSRCSNGR